ncbi:MULTISPECIES: hypothetical protein [Erwinia]|uniref:hypothetical protein n=1 Tax=Erwinia TaxID=551 RepID=UPI00105C147E|nr:hypothetical protein [Erwinia aphidicola]MCP2233043.1 hypothetical protein [Erwinia aphidicola]
MIKKAVLAALAITVFIQSPAHAISEKYRQQLERSGCTQQSELQGCDIHKSKQQNARAGFSDKTMQGAANGLTAFAGNYIASQKNGGKVAEIHIEGDSVYVDGKEVADVNHVGDVLTFQQDDTVYTLYLNNKGNNSWKNSDSETSGPVSAE